MRMSRLEHFGWIAVYLFLLSLLFVLNARSEETQPAPTQTDIVLERVIPRGCLISVQMDDPAQCHVESITLTPESECRAPVGQPLKCSRFGIVLNKDCRYKVTKRADCEVTNVKKVPRVESVK